jgi:exopolysaccharide production protein ExoQ
MAMQEMSNRSVLESLKSAVATLVVVFFFTVFNIIPFAIVPVSIVAVFLLCCLLYYRELFYFFTKNPTVFIYPLIAVLSATWSIVPSKTVWYAFQLCITVGGAIFMGITATPRQLVRGIFIAMAIVIIASVISGRMGASAVGPVLVGITGGKTVIGLVAVTLFGSGMAILFDPQQPPLYRLATLPLIPLGAYIATHVEAATALVSVFAFPIAFFGFLSLRYVSPMGRSAVVALLLLVFIPLAVLTYTGVPDVNQRILRALNKDATLTGRTMMWVKAEAWIERSHEIGYGFRAFWTSESADSMGILHSFKLTDGRVFQLHNTMEEMRVDTGWLGLLAFLSTVMIFLCYIIAFVFLYPSASSAFIATMYLIILAHSPVEVLIGVFYPTTAFFYVCGTVAIAFFMNRQQITRDQARTATRGDGHFAWQGRIGQPALPPNHGQSI